ncbi:hypothetical protein JVX90_10920 [Gordonia sp. PDNC005]|uniref:hypothetical protein n=1 Tax=unclassified Gordonia (in: high G+C Gram-positive bacteria) TaxID=2657482 RepID=UPI00196313B9|nr:hypothetical protein [Gordonia sp. PDNC005]QRY60968.1 hypothetical protein JVX90_10920 [Gordonia sp. PDNC005]
MSSSSDDTPTPLDGDDFLAVNRANRERIRVEEAGKADDAVDLTKSGDTAELSGSGRRNVVVVALGATVAVLVVAVIVLGVLLAGKSGNDGGTDEQGALRDAKTYASEMFTYQSGKYDDLDRRIRAISAPEFADEYIKSSQLARKANDEAKASSKGSATSAGIVSIDPDQAVVLVALDMAVTSPDAPVLGQGDPSQSRVELTLVKTDGRWLVSGLDVV